MLASLRPTCHVLIPLLLFATYGLAPSALAQSDDPDARFLESLRTRGWHELALEYLEKSASNEAITEAFRARIPYERAVTRLDEAKSVSDPVERERGVARARTDLENYLKSTSDPALAAEGNSQLAEALASQGRIAQSQADKLGDKKDAKQREALLAKSRSAYEEARQFFQESAKSYTSALEAYKSVRPGSPEARERASLKIRLAGAQVQGSRSLYEQAKTYDPESKEFKLLNKQAADELLVHYDNNYDQPIGMYAHLYEGWCYQALGQHKLAIGCYEELIIQDSDVPIFRQIITLAHVYLAKSRIAEKQLEKSAEAGLEWLKELRKGEAASAAAALQYQVAEAKRLIAEGKEGAEAKKMLAEARLLYRDAARAPSEFQADARLQLLALNEKLGAESQPPATFAEAYQIGKDAIVEMNAARLAARVNEGDASVVTQQIAEARLNALTAFEQTLALVDGDTPSHQVNEVRYLTSWLHWEGEQYLRAAAMGEFLAMVHSKDPSAEGAAKLALAAFERLYNQAIEQETDATFAEDKLRRLAEFSAQQWAGQPTADAAFSVLLGMALRSGDMQDARRVVGLAPENRQASMQLKLASAMWEKSVRASTTAGSDPTSRNVAQRGKADALAMLNESFAKVRDAGAMTAPKATAALYLAQALLDSGDAEGAAKLLEDKTVGPLTLVQAGAAAVKRPGYAAETYKTALRAYTFVTPPRTDDAFKMMDLLEKTVSSAGAGALTRVYFGLGIQIQQQIADLAAAGKKAEAERLAGAFGVFLERLMQRSADADWVTQQWIGQTLLKLAEGLGDGADEATRKDYSERATKVFEALIARAGKDPQFPPTANSVLAARMQLGQAQRQMGAYKEAIDTLSSILVERSVMLDVQKAAAYTYQQWGEEDTTKLMSAIRGGQLDQATNKNVIWGWNKLSSIAARAARKQPKYKDLFFECWLNVATCRYLAGEQSAGKDRDKQLASARRTIRSMRSQYPDLGGPQRRKQFDSLLKRIQRLEGKDPIGLDELKQ